MEVPGRPAGHPHPKPPRHLQRPIKTPPPSQSVDRGLTGHRMPEVWPQFALAQLRAAGAVAFGDGYRTRVDQLDSEGIPILRVADIGDASIKPSFKDRVASIHRPRMGTKTSRTGDVLVTTKGTVGRIARVSAELPEHVYSPQLCYIRALAPQTIDPLWIYYCFRTPEIRQQLGVYKDQTDMAPYISLTDLQRVELPLPPISEQRRIAGVLGAFDDLIDTNTRLADQMDTLLSTVVRDALDRAEESEPLSSYADFVNGRNFTKGADGTGRPVIRTPEVRLGPSGSTPRSSIDAVDANVARSGDTLFVWSGSLTLGRWRWEDGLINQHVFKVIPRTGLPDWLPHQLIQRQLPWFLSLAADKATTMGHIQRRHLDAPVPALETSVLSRLDEIAGPLWAASLDARIGADRLAGVRDELLPLLMSGRVTVDEAWEGVPE